MSQARAGHISAVLPNGDVLVAGGQYRGTGFNDAVADAEVYAPSSGLWRAGPSMHEPRSHFAATTLTDGRIVVAGGGSLSTGGSDLTTEIFDANAADGGAPDSGTPDTGTPDTGTPDTGGEAGSTDAGGGGPDAARADAGVHLPDSGLLDASLPDACGLPVDEVDACPGAIASPASASPSAAPPDDGGCAIHGGPARVSNGAALLIAAAAAAARRRRAAKPA